MATFPPFDFTVSMEAEFASLTGQFSVQVEGTFHSAHFLRAYFPDGSDEPVHGHTWKVELCISRSDDALGSDGICVDFVPIQERLAELLKRIGHCCVNDLPEFATVNPTAENIARWFYAGMQPAVAGMDARLQEVRVHEGPGNVAIFRRA